jgi:cardiolipin synthase
MADVWTGARNVILPLAWAFALWGIGLYWWSGYIYLKQLRSVVIFERSETAKVKA